MSEVELGVSKNLPDRTPITHKLVVGLALPMTLAYLTTPLLGLVDTAVIGQLGDAALLGGLAVGGVLIALVFATLNFLRSGTTGLAAQALGAGDDKEIKAILIRALVIAFSIGVVLALLSPAILAIGLWSMDPGGAVGAATGEYFLIRMLAAPFALMNYALLGWFIGLGKAGIGLGLQILLNGTNIIFSIGLGLWLGWGIPGVAIATIIGEVTATIIGLLLVWYRNKGEQLPSRKRLLDVGAIKRLLSLNSDIMIRSFALLIAFAYFTAQGAKFGELTLAANSILMHLFLIAGYFLDGLATAAEQLAGRTIGAADRMGFRRALKLTSGWNFTIAAILTLIFFISGTWIVELLTTSPDIRTEADQYLLWAILIPLTGVLAFQMDGVFIGATWSRDMSIMMVVSLIIFFITFIVTRDIWGNHALWLSLHVFVVVRGVTLAARLPINIRTTFGADNH